MCVWYVYDVCMHLITSCISTVFIDSSYITGYLITTSCMSMGLGIFCKIPVTISSTICRWERVSHVCTYTYILGVPNPLAMELIKWPPLWLCPRWRWLWAAAGVQHPEGRKSHSEQSWCWRCHAGRRSLACRWSAGRGCTIGSPANNAFQISGHVRYVYTVHTVPCESLRQMQWNAIEQGRLEKENYKVQKNDKVSIWHGDALRSL